MSENFERLGNYILLEKINAGGMAEVYLSKSIGANGVNKFLAIKRILPQFADNQEFLDMFKEEAKIAVNLSHNNVVSIIDFKASKNQLYLVMEYVQGQNLRQVLQQKKKKGLTLSLDYIVYLIREVAAGLDHAHRCVDKATGKPLNIIHRDMSPQNIMISYDGEIKIVDFGIAKAEAAGEHTRVGTLKGKFSYMSPEQAEGLVIDQGSDIFSLGIILWELIADDRLFVANNEMNILKRIKECDVPELRRINPQVPVELERIVKRALLKDKTLRYQSSADLQKDLTRFLNKEYPDFTPSDFSTFMKFLFESEYQLAQERIVNYAKLDFGSLSEFSESTQFTKSTIVKPAPVAPPTPPPIDRDSQPHSNMKPQGPPQGFNAGEIPDPLAQTVLDADPGPLQLPEAPHQATFTGLTHNTGLKKNNAGAYGPRNRASSTNSQYATRSGITSSGIRYRAPAKAPISEFAKALFTFVLVGVMVSSLYFFTPKKLKSKLSSKTLALYEQIFNKHSSPEIHPNDIEKAQLENPSKEGFGEIASNAATVSLLVKSNPGRARIYVDEKDQGLTTPATVEVPLNKPLNLTLLADGYVPYTTRLSATKDGQEVDVNLNPLKYGYLNINVINAGVDTIISIDGQELKDRPPINKHPIPSGQPVTVRALHPFSGTSAETTVTVGVDEKRTLDLILSNPATHSTNKGRAGAGDKK